MNRHEHARMVHATTEDAVISLLQDAGYDVQTHGHVIYGRITINGTLRIQIKGALWTKHAHSGGRYQFCLRQGHHVYILECIAHAPRYFVVPGRVIAGKTNVAIWSEFPSKYVGKWAEYCDAWHIIDEELARCKNSVTA